MIGPAQNPFAGQMKDLLKATIHQQVATIKVLDVYDGLRIIDDLLNQLLALSQGEFGFLCLRDVADKSREHGRTSARHTIDAKLDQDGRAVGATAGNFNATAKNPCLTCRQIECESALVPGA